MFGRADVYATVNAFNVRVKDEREQDKNHLVEVTFEVPLTFELIEEISPAVARDLFDTIRGEHVARPELNDAGLNLSPEPQLMLIKNHPELDPEVRIAGVGLRKIRAKKGEGDTWLLAFTATWTLGDSKEATVMISRLKQGVYLSLTPQAPKLDLQDAAPGDQQALANVDGTGTVTSIKRGRGRPRKTTPEQEAAAQETQARQQLPADDGDAGGESADAAAETAADDTVRH